MKKLLFLTFAALAIFGCGGDNMDELPCLTCPEAFHSSGSPSESSGSYAPSSSSSEEEVPGSSSSSDGLSDPSSNSSGEEMPGPYSSSDGLSDPSSSSVVPSSSGGSSFGGGGNACANLEPITIGTQTWAKKNLDCDVSGSKCYDNDPSNCATYGRLYDWNTAMTVCPSGWHLPSNEEWDRLYRFVDENNGNSGYDDHGDWGYYYTVGKHLKSATGWNFYSDIENLDTYGFSALPGGRGDSYGSFNYGFNYVGSSGYWWSSSEYRYSATNAGSRRMDYDENARWDNSAKSYLFSVRCVKDGGEKSSSSISSSSVRIGKGNNINNYETVVIGTQTWMAENLDYNVPNSKCYDNLDSNCGTYGRLYDWATAMNLPLICNSSDCSGQIQSPHQGVCPSGWHIPSQEEWNTLSSYVQSNSGCSSCDARLLKSTSGWYYNGNGTDAYGFSALPGGRGDSYGSFYSVGGNGHWWISNEYNATSAYPRGMHYSLEYAYWDLYDKSSLFSVRCLKD